MIVIVRVTWPSSQHGPPPWEIRNPRRIETRNGRTSRDGRNNYMSTSSLTASTRNRACEPQRPNLCCNRGQLRKRYTRAVPRPDFVLSLLSLDRVLQPCQELACSCFALQPQGATSRTMQSKRRQLHAASKIKSSARVQRNGLPPCSSTPE